MEYFNSFNKNIIKDFQKNLFKILIKNFKFLNKIKMKKIILLINQFKSKMIQISLKLKRINNNLKNNKQTIKILRIF
jgi:hypothetical protein